MGCHEYWINQLNTLRGYTIGQPICDDVSGETPFYGLEVVSPTGQKKELWFLGDEEANFGGVPSICDPLEQEE